MIMKSQKGLALYLSIMIMVILLAVVLGISTILVSQLKVIRNIENSVVAYYAAETGIEQALEERQGPNLSGYSGTLNNATYSVEVSESGDSGCSAAHYCIKSVGNYNGAKRAIQVSYWGKIQRPNNKCQIKIKIQNPKNLNFEIWIWFDSLKFEIKNSWIKKLR